MLDEYDKKILKLLQDDARMPTSEVARQVNLSKTPVAARIKQMEQSGLIAGYRAMISPIQLGLTHVTYVQVKLSDTRESTLNTFNAAVRKISEVEECYLIAGGFDYLIKVRSRDMAHFRQVLGEQLSFLPNVSATSSFVAMEAVVEDTIVEL